MRLSVAFVVAAAALLTADAAKINNKRRLGNGNNKNNAATGEERNLSSSSGKGKGSSGGTVNTMPMEGGALTRAEADGLNRGQICAAGQARSSMMEMIFPMNMAGSTGTGKGKSGKVSESIGVHTFICRALQHIHRRDFGLLAQTGFGRRIKSRRSPHQAHAGIVDVSTLRFYGI